MRTQAGRHGVALGGTLLALALQFADPTGRAHADDGSGKEVAVMVPPRTEAGIGRGMGERAVGVVARALRADGYSVIEPAQAVAIAESVQAEAGKERPEDSDLDQCTTADCAIWYRAVLNAALAVQMTLFTKVGPAARSNVLDTVTLVILQRANVQFSGSATVRDGDLETAVLTAYRAAREKQIKGVGPWLTVRGEPAGAQVLLDGEMWGALPHKDSVSAGIHAVLVQKTGYTKTHESVRVGEKSDAETVVEVRLEPESAAVLAAAGSHGQRRPKRSPWNYIVGGAAFAVGAVYVAGAAVTLSRDGDVSDGDRYEAGMGTKFKLLGGLIGVAAGVTLCVWAPLRMKVQVDETRAAVEIEQRF